MCAFRLSPGVFVFAEWPEWRLTVDDATLAKWREAKAAAAASGSVRPLSLPSIVPPGGSLAQPLAPARACHGRECVGEGGEIWEARVVRHRTPCGHPRLSPHPASLLPPPCLPIPAPLPCVTCLQKVLPPAPRLSEMLALSDHARAEAVEALDATVANACASATAALPKALAALPAIASCERCVPVG